MANDFGLKNVVIKNIERAIKRSQFISCSEQLDILIDQLKHEIESNRDLWKDLILTVHGCDHRYNNTTFTVQNRIIGHATVYERTCKDCGYIENHSAYSEYTGEPLPSWTENATRQHYNNII
jgi:hypothetical protein